MSKWRMRHRRANLHSSAHPQREIAEVRFNMLARGWLAYPVTPCAHTATAEERLYKHTEANALQTGSPPKTKFPTAKPQPETV